jgi:hypothetical protein
MRNQHGNISSFGAELVAGTSAVIAFLFFLLDSSIYVLYHEKLTFVTQQTVLFSAAYTGQDNQTATRQFAERMCAQMGLQVSNLKTTVSDVSFNGQSGVNCSISASLPLLLGVPFLPGSVSLSDQASALHATSGASTFSVSIVGNNNVIKLSKPAKVVVQ